jgi:branched-chain amino acid aminotransferase
VFAPTSSLVTAGEGWFETLRVQDGRPMALKAHLDRLSRSVAAGLGPEAAQNASSAAQRCVETMMPVFDEFPSGRLRLLLALDAVGERWQALGEWGRYNPSPSSIEAGVASVTASFPHPGLGLLGKSASYHWSIMARREAFAQGAAEALLVRDGCVLEGATSALVWCRDGRWSSSDSPAVLPSVTLATLRETGIAIDAGELRSDDLKLGAAAPIEGLVLLSALRLAVAVGSVDGTVLPTGRSLRVAAEWRTKLLAHHRSGSP